MATSGMRKGSRIVWKLISAVVLMLGLVACAGETGEGSGTLALSITDAPVDGAERVVVEFTGVEIQTSAGRHTIDYADPKTINLLALQNGMREYLLEGYVLPVGNVSWIRLRVNAVADGVMDSYIDIVNSDTMPDGRYELNVPSGSQSGLRLNNSFNVVDGEYLDFTIDFDLRKSVHQPMGQTGPSGDPVYFLRPTLRLVDADVSGEISGVVDPLIFVINEQNCSAQESGYAVYLYEGDVTPDDMDGADPDPVSTAMVTAGNGYGYTLAFIEPGEYTIALTCNGDLDEPDTDDAVVTFVGTAPISVAAGATISHDF